MKTTLIYPGIAGYGFASVGKGMEAGWISHGLAHLSSAAKAQGFEIDLIDLRALDGWDHFSSEIAARQPDVVGLRIHGWIEERENAVAQELVDEGLVPVQHLAHSFEIQVQQSLCALGAELLTDAGEAFQIAEEASDLAGLGPGKRLGVFGQPSRQRARGVLA